MNLSLDNPYGNVTIPRAKLRSSEDPSLVITNPHAIYTTSAGARSSALNPYGSFKPQGGEVPSATPVYAVDNQPRTSQNPPPYEIQTNSYTLKEDDEEVGCCRRCWCFCCRRKKK